MEFTECSDEEMDVADVSRDPSEIDDTSFVQDPHEDPAWQRQWPLQFSMETVVGAAGKPEESLNHAKWALYQDIAILDDSGVLGTDPRIRLLQIQPGAAGDLICCKLIRRPLWDEGKYCALSYSWGTDPPSREVFIESRRNSSRVLFTVSAHLFNALERLRKEQYAVEVWIDAICINQMNIVERAAQVQIMAQIFNTASEVRVWLGEVDSYEDGVHTTDRELFWSLCQRSSPWWTRLWIIQECAYADKEPLIMLGACSMSFGRLIQRWQSAVRVSNDPTYSELDDALTTNLEFLRMPFNAWKAQMTGSTHRLPLLQRLRETTGRHCSDPHDRIYALLSLIDENEESRLEPDYRKPFMDLMFEVSEVLRQSRHWEERRDGDLLRQFDLESCVVTALTRGETLSEYSMALEEASHKGYSKVVQALLDRCACLTAKKEHIEKALLAAARTNHAIIVRLLIHADQQLNVQSYGHDNVLQKASVRGHKNVVAGLLAKSARIKAQGGYYSNALQAASERGNGKVVEILAAKSVDVNAQGGHYGNALQAASYGGHEKVVEMLLAEGAHINAQGGWHENALQAASVGGYEKVVEILLVKGADVNAQGGYYGNALQAASYGGHEKVVEILLIKGANVNAQGGFYGNALQAASHGGHEKVVEILLIKGANINARGGSYGNALQAASEGRHENVMGILVAKGVEPLGAESRI